MRFLKFTKIKKAYRWFEIMFINGVLLYLLFFLIKYFAIGIFQVPTSSMQNTIWPGDWIVAEKISFGARLPWDGKLYRVPGLSSVKRGDVVVFNFPEGDTVFVNTPQKNYYEIVRWHIYCNDIEKISAYGETAVLPTNYRVPYVKRCVGLPGDTMIIEDGIINVCSTKKTWQVKGIYKFYYCSIFKLNRLKEVLGYRPNMWDEDEYIVISLSNFEKKKLLLINGVDSIIPKLDDRVFVSTFPFLKNKPIAWSHDNYGPLYIPEKGSQISLTKNNIYIYRRAIEVYEHNNFELRNDSVFINKKYTKTYTFKKNYYFMMGDNRSFSFDSRNWGFVSEDHIIGKMFMIGWSREQNSEGWESIRWNRVGKVMQ